MFGGDMIKELPSPTQNELTRPAYKAWGESFAVERRMRDLLKRIDKDIKNRQLSLDGFVAGS